ncbi:hypothetical protein ACHQM5_000436 [Ranunculus cassubicifolius]
MPTQRFLFLLTFLILLNSNLIIRVAEAGMKKVHIPDELDDVIDDEEDEEWKKWGEKSKKDEKFDPPPLEEGMDPKKFQAEMMKRHVGPTFGFVKLGLGVKRSKDMVAEIAMKWTRVLKTGAIEARFMGVDLNTIMVTMQLGKDTSELIEFILSQPEAYEVKIGDQLFRRPGDPSLDDLIEKQRSEQQKYKDSMILEEEDEEHSKEEL